MWRVYETTTTKSHHYKIDWLTEKPKPRGDDEKRERESERVREKTHENETDTKEPFFQRYPDPVSFVTTKSVMQKRAPPMRMQGEIPMKNSL